jgi:predicted  nucleic acid-binding Zn-ribbon protein
MADVTNELIYSVLQKLQEEVSATRHDVREIKGELTAMRGYIYALHQDIGNIYASMARSEGRLDRVERRLELRESELT